MMPQPTKPNVLIIDDNPANRLAFGSLLEADYTLSVADSGAQGLELALLKDFAAILLDVRMPGMDGFEVAELLRKRERTRYTPIIFMSAYDRTTNHARKGYLCGATDFIFSPVDEDLLKYKVAAYVQLYLRNESLWLQILQLQATVRSLQVEIGRSFSMQPLALKVRRLELQIEALKDQIDPIPL